MATDLQNELYRSNKQFSYLSELMAGEIYPRLIDALKKLGMESVCFEGVNNWLTFHITLSGEIQFVIKNTETKEIKIHSKLKFAGKNQCPLFAETTHKPLEKYESPFPKYKVYCEAIINKLEELEKNFTDADSIIKKIESMGVSLQRSVMIEKTDKHG